MYTVTRIAAAHKLRCNDDWGHKRFLYNNLKHNEQKKQLYIVIVLNFISPNQVQMLKLFPGTDHKTWQILVLYGDRKMLWENGGKQAYSATRTQTNAEVTCIFPANS